MGRKPRKKYNDNNDFIDSLILNDDTYTDYYNRLKRIALSRFEYVNLPSTMNAEFLEKTLFYDGIACGLIAEGYGKINTRCTGSSELNIYHQPTGLHCYSFNFSEDRKLFVNMFDESEKEKSAVLIKNNIDSLPTSITLTLFAYRLTEAERTCDVNIKGQKYPLVLVGPESQRLTLENIFNKINGNQPVIFGDKENLDENKIHAIKTDSPYIADKVMEYKKEIWNEALTFLGINNLVLEKKERMITDEANGNNELINMNLQSYLIPRQEACEKLNELFGITDEDKKIYVRVRSDLRNIIKNELSSTKDYNTNDESEGEENG